MGGPRITDDQKNEMREMRKKGYQLADIAATLGVSTTAVRIYTADVEVEVTSIYLEDGEVLSEIEGYDGHYHVSSGGKVFTTNSINGLRPMKMHQSKLGGLKVTLKKGDSVKMMRVDKIVADAFCEKASEDCTAVKHLDGDINNNRSENLVWVKPSPKRSRASRNKTRKLDSEAVADIRKRWLAGENIKALANDYQVSVSTAYKELDGLLRDIPYPPCEPGEEWVPIRGYEESYYISSHGRVYSTGRGRREPRMLAHYDDRDGYKTVQLTNEEGESRKHFVHRLVAAAFCDGYDSKHSIVNHKDGDPSNNHADNLEWVTPQENTRHAIDVLGYDMGGSRPFETRSQREVPPTKSKISPVRRFTDEEAIAIRNDPRSARQLAKAYGVNKCTIVNIRRGFTYKNLP